MKHERVHRLTVVALLASVVLLLPALARAQELANRPLPEFRVAAGDGQEVLSTALSGENQWLLIYVSPDSPSSRRLVTALKDWQSASLIGRTVLVVRAPAAEAQAWAKKNVPAELEGLRVFADVRAEAWSALELQGTPVLLGIEKERIAWRLAGVLNKPGALESVVRTWVEAR